LTRVAAVGVFGIDQFIPESVRHRPAPGESPRLTQPRETIRATIYAVTQRDVDCFS
jgi:hypothetical protein